MQVPLPRAVKPLRDGIRIARAAAGERHSLFLSSSGAVLACGDSGAGALGLGDAPAAATPQHVLPLWPLGVVQVACGGSHSAAMTSDGRLFTWGRNRHGQLGLGDFEGRATPTPVKDVSGASQVRRDPLHGHHVSRAAAGLRQLWVRDPRGPWAWGPAFQLSGN